MFSRPHHRRIAILLESLKADQLLKFHCLFGGGTAIALSRGEYRQSVDIDFICSSREGYRGMRELVAADGIAWAFARQPKVVREPKVDQYGIRCALGVEDVPIKFEIVYEGRVELDDPLPEDRVCGAWTMTAADLAATKLMANADRWADDSVMNRDLIDLAMLADQGVLPSAGIDKARRAYGTSIDTCFDKARESLLGRERRLLACMANMDMTMPESELRRRIEALSLGRRAGTR